MRQSLVAFFAAAAVTVVITTQARAGEAEVKAQAAAAAWLGLTDVQQYAQSWDQAATLLQKAVTKAKWESAIRSVRTPLGNLKGRKLKSATFMRTLPNAPEGEYVVLVFESAFENKADAIETVTPMKEADGSWKVSGYYIR